VDASSDGSKCCPRAILEVIMNSYDGDDNRRSGACMVRWWNSQCRFFCGTVSWL
jgi:hypothetical protein